MSPPSAAQEYSLAPYAPELREASRAALVDAFTDDPLFTFIVPSLRERLRWMPHLVDELIHQTEARGWNRVALTAVGDVAGACLAGPYPPSAWQNFRMNLRLGLLPSPWEPAIRPLMRSGGFQEVWKKMHHRGPHVYVYVIGVAREHHRRGLGRWMMEDLIAQTNEAGLPIYLETQTASNVPFYEGLGFHLTDEQRPFDDGPPSWGFFRDVG